jgi:hypothetical protein
MPTRFEARDPQVWLTMGTAVRLDEIFDQLLASGAEMAQIHWVPHEQPE